MSRTISYPAHSEAFKAQTEKVFLVLLTIAYEDGGTNYIRVVNNEEDIVTVSDTWTAYPFEITLPEDIEDRLPEAKLMICNVERLIIEALRTVTTPPEVTIQVVLSDTPTVIEEEYDNLILRDITYDAKTVTGTLVYENILSESFPTHIMDPSNCPGLFGLPSGTWGS